MGVLDDLAEARIKAAMARGELDDLPGAGKPLVLEDDALVPAELRMAYRLLKNAGCVPPELELRKAIADAERWLVEADDPAEREQIRRRLLALWRAQAMSRHGAANLSHEALSYGRLVARLAGGREQAD